MANEPSPTDDKIYKNWELLPSCWMRIQPEPGQAGRPERMRGVCLPDGSYGIYGLPENGFYRIHDIVSSRSLPACPEEGMIIRRRWRTEVTFQYDQAQSAAKAEAQRADIIHTLTPLGYPYVWPSDLVQMHFAEEMDADGVEDLLDDVLFLRGINVTYVSAIRTRDATNLLPEYD